MDEINTSYNNKQVMTDYIQFLVIFVVICVSSVNLTFQWGNQNLWTILLCTCMAYLMPSPEVKNSIKNLTNVNV